MDEAIAAGREAVAATPTDHPNRPSRLSNLGSALQARFEHTGQLAVLDEAIAVGREAVAAAPADHPNRPSLLSNLGAALQARFLCTGEQTDLDEAIAVGREAVAAAPADHPNRPNYLSNLGVALHKWFELTSELPMLFKGAVELSELYTSSRHEITTRYLALHEEAHRNLIDKVRPGHTAGTLEETVSRLEEWRLETLAAVTLRLPPDTASDHQVLPIRYYIDTNDRAVAEDVERALESLLNDCGFRAEKRYPIETGSFFRKLFYSSRERLTPEEVAASLVKIERAAGVRALDLPQSQVDANKADGVAKLLPRSREARPQWFKLDLFCWLKSTELLSS